MLVLRCAAREDVAQRGVEVARALAEVLDIMRLGLQAVRTRRAQ